jgi:hypothetical protein
MLGVYETQMNFMFRLGFYPQGISLYICKYPQSEIQIISGCKNFA